MLWATLALGFVVAGCGEKDESVTSPARTADSGTDGQFNRKVAHLEHKLQRIRERSGDRGGGGGGAISLDGLVALGDRLGADVGATVGPPGSGAIASGGDLLSGAAWSTIKVPIALRVLEDAGGPDGLSAAQDGEIERALTASDNEAAEALFGELAATHGGTAGAADAVTEVLREAGDEETIVSTEGRDGFSPYGQTEWALPAQHRFMAALAGGCVADEASRVYVLELMGQVTSDAWGLGSAGVPARWKGGWGPGTDGRYLVRQMGIVELGSGQIVVTVAVRPDDGTFESGQTIATDVVDWLVEKADGIAQVPGAC